MRILLCVNRDIVGCYALNLLLPRLCDRHEVTVFLSDRLMKPQDRKIEALEQLQFFERDLLLNLLFPLIDRHPPSDPTLRSFDGLARHHRIPIRLVTRINSDAGVEAFRQAQPELILSVRYGYVFGERILALPPRGVYNVHSGILPDYRGTMPTFRAMMSGRGEAGITLHRIPDTGIDTGDIVAMETIPVRPERCMFGHIMALYEPAATMVTRLVEDMTAGHSVHAQPQDESRAQYYTFPTEEEIAAFHAAGLTLLDHTHYQHWLRCFTEEEALPVSAAASERRVA